MRIAVGADHAGYDLKEALKTHISNLGHEISDLGTNSRDPVDYPDFARAVGMAIVENKADRGVLICGSGVGASIAANKIPGVRAAVCHDCYSAAQGVEHDDMNVLTLGARIIGHDLAEGLVTAFLGAKFSGEERHLRRIKKVLAMESEFLHRQR